MSLPTFSMRQLIEAGCHFGHNTRRWNPKMDSYLFGVRDGVHIIDLQQTVPLLHRAMQAVHDAVAEGGRVLFVGTKRAAHDLVKEYAERCGQYYVNHRWLGGMLTNWKTISKSIKRLKDLEERFTSEDGMAGLTKKEQLNLERERTKLDLALGGIKDMGALPDLIFVVDTNKEDIAVAEANKLHIPVVGILDSNSNPKGIDYPVPGNDDAIRAIKLYLELMANSALEGIQDQLKAAGVDVGAQEKAPKEDLPAKPEVKSKAKADVAKSDVAKSDVAKSDVAKSDAAKAAPAEEAKPEPAAATPAEPAAKTEAVQPQPAQAAEPAAAEPAAAELAPKPEPKPKPAKTAEAKAEPKAEPAAKKAAPKKPVPKKPATKKAAAKKAATAKKAAPKKPAAKKKSAAKKTAAKK